MYLVACHMDASVYSLTNSPEWLHQGLWYFQLLQLFTLAKSMHVLDTIIVVGYDKGFEDDIANKWAASYVSPIFSQNKLCLCFHVGNVFTFCKSCGDYLKWLTSIPPSAHLRSSPSIVQFLLEANVICWWWWQVDQFQQKCIKCCWQQVQPVPSSPICLNQLPSHLLRLVVNHCQVIMVMIGHVVNLPLTCFPSTRGDGLQRISSTPKCFAKQSLTMSVKALWLLWLEKGANDAEGKVSCHTAKHKKAQRWDTGTSSVVIPLEMTECLNKMEQKQIKFLLGNK